MLSVITTISADTPAAWLSQCRASIKVAAATAGFPVEVVEVPGVPGNIGQARADGLAKSTQPWVCWVDDDDLVLPHAFSCLGGHFAANPTAVCAREMQLLANGILRPSQGRHHLTAYRRDVAAGVPLPEYRALPDRALLIAATPGAVDEMSWVYIYRMHRSGASALRSQFGAAEQARLQGASGG